MARAHSRQTAMIRYTLRCDRDHEFESWFQSADAFARLEAAGRLSCAVCGGTGVSKSLMAPAVRAGHDDAGAPGDLSTPRSPVEQALAALRRHVEENSEYVGLKFADEARAIHAGDSPGRAIHGEARPDDARALLEEGVPVAPLPFRTRRRAH